MRFVSVGACISAIFSNLGASAASVPTLSGVYIFNSEETCPSVLVPIRTSTGLLTNIVTTAPGDVTINVLTLTFTPGVGTPDKGTLTGSGYQSELVGTLEGPGQTIQSSDKTVTVSGTFSNTANSISLVGGDKLQFHIVYGTLKNGIAQSASFTGLTKLTNGSPPTTVTCVEHGTLTHI